MNSGVKAIPKMIILLAKVFSLGLAVKGNRLPESVDMSLLDELRNSSDGFGDRVGITAMLGEVGWLYPAIFY